MSIPRKREGANTPDPKDVAHVSVVDVLNSTLADLNVGGIRPEAATPDKLHARVIRIWWSACAEAVATAPDQLAAWHRAAKEATGDNDLEGAARVVTGLGTILASTPSIPLDAAGIDAAVEHYAKANVLPDLTDVKGRRLFPVAAARRLPEVIAELERLADKDGKQAAVAMVMIQAAMLSGAEAAPRFGQGIRVLFDTDVADAGGETGTLRMAVLPGGPPGLYPDPATMTFLRANTEFADSLTAAWGRVFGSRRAKAPCVLWTIDQEGRQHQFIQGGSLGAAFAVGMHRLSRRKWLHRLTRIAFLRAFQTECAVTGPDLSRS